MSALEEYMFIRGWGTFLRTFVRLLTQQVFRRVICRGSNMSAARRRLHYCVTKASSILLRLPDPAQVEDVDTGSYPAS